MKKRPHWRVSAWQRSGSVFRYAYPGKDIAGGTGCSVKARAQAVDDDDRHQLRDPAPFLPAMETPQVIRAHDPDKSNSGAAGQQPRYRIVGISRLNDSFEAGHIDAWMVNECPRGSDSFRQRCKPAGVF